MNKQTPLNKTLGFTPINQEDVIELSPKLKEFINKFSEFNVHFKTPDKTLLKPDVNQKVTQGSITLPHSSEIIDFELATDYLMVNANLVTMTRNIGSQTWGDSISVSDEIPVKNINNLVDGFTRAVSKSAQEESLRDTPELRRATYQFDKRVKSRNEELKRQQALIVKIDPNIHKI